MKSFLATFFFLSAFTAFGQYNFKGILLDRKDSTSIPFAVIKLSATENYALTDINGEFNFQMKEDLNEIPFEITAIGVKEYIRFHPAHVTPEKIYVDVSSFDLSSATVIGLSAKEMILKAISLISKNYTDSSFVAFSFYREYEKVNGKFKNLIEAEAAVLSKISAEKKSLQAGNSIAILQMRRSNFKYDIDGFYLNQNDFLYLLDQDPVFNLSAGALNPNGFTYYRFRFDTITKSDDYIINYVCDDFSSESHGIENFSELGWFGEGLEAGKITIDSKTFAFKKIERKAVRNKHFHYPKNNNFLRPNENDQCEFVDGKLISEYENVHGKWFLKKLCHEFTNEFYDAFSGEKDFTITQLAEFYVDSVTHFVTPGLDEKFHSSTYLPTCTYSYDTNAWKKDLPPFYFFSINDVYRDMEIESNLETQFLKSSK